MTERPDQSEQQPWRIWLTAGVILLVLAVDQMTKTLVLDHLGPGSGNRVIEVIPGLLRFRYLENTGAAFGLFQGNSALLTVLAVSVVLFLLVYFRRSIERSSWLAVALGMQIGGAFGNIVDRLRFGFVIDFINVPRWPTFNVADSAITVGVVILAATLLFSGETVFGEDEKARSDEHRLTPPEDHRSVERG